MKNYVSRAGTLAIKIWNALRLVKGWEVSDIAQPVENQLAVEWIKGKFGLLVGNVEDYFRMYKLSEASMEIYNFIWNDFCSWYLEMIKPEYGQPIDQKTLDETIDVFEKIMIVLHPLMPFLTEEVYHLLKERESGEDCIVASFPSIQPIGDGDYSEVDAIRAIISKVREVRASKGLKQKELLTLYVESKEATDQLYTVSGSIAMMKKLAFLGEFTSVKELPDDGVEFMADNKKFFIPIELEINVEDEKEKLKKEIEYAEGFLKSVEKKLSNERFVNNAPEQVVANERKKQADGEERLKILKESLEKLG